MATARYILKIAFWIILSAQSLLAYALPPNTTGIILLHSKGGEPANLEPLGNKLSASGFHVTTPRLAWAKSRNYDLPYDKAIGEIAAAVAELRSNGHTHIVLIGHSLGGIAALKESTNDVALTALVLIAPAHFPEGDTAQKLAADSVARARDIVNKKTPETVSNFVEVPSGKALTLSASVYLSYYDPAGPAAMSLFAQDVKTKNILWLAADNDPATSKFAALIAPKIPKSVTLDRLDIHSDHGSASTVAENAIVEWLIKLKRIDGVLITQPSSCVRERCTSTHSAI